MPRLSTIFYPHFIHASTRLFSYYRLTVLQIPTSANSQTLVPGFKVIFIALAASIGEFIALSARGIIGPSPDASSTGSSHLG